MSQQETITGKLKLIPKIEGESLEEQCKRVYCEKYNPPYNPKEYCDTWDEALNDIGYKKIVIYNDNIYEVIERKCFDDLDIFQITDNKDGTYNFTLSYYNGGCSFDEAIEEAFKNMEGVII